MQPLDVFTRFLTYQTDTLHRDLLICKQDKHIKESPSTY